MAERNDVVTAGEQVPPEPAVNSEPTAAPDGIEVARAERPAVSIVIVTYGTGPIVLDAISAVAEHTADGFELIVVDNPHPERGATADLLRSRTSGIELLTPNRNLGFGAGNDLAAARASGEFLCLLNPDVIVAEGWLDPLVAALDDPVVGVAGPVLTDPDGALQEAGQLIYDDGCTAAVGGPEVMTGDWAQAFSRDVDYVSAACWVVRCDEHLARGGFDDRYWPAFFEDADYALRVEAAGQRTRLVTDVPVCHHRGLGGAGRDHELGHASLQVFRSIWSDRLRDQPPRPASERGALVNRGRLAGARVG
ncbi:MAG: glycosyltransferase, partial [Ilumatobacteraceae bacterium]